MRGARDNEENPAFVFASSNLDLRFEARELLLASSRVVATLRGRLSLLILPTQHKTTRTCMQKELRKASRSYCIYSNVLGKMS